MRDRPLWRRPGGWSRSRKAVSGARPVSGCGWNMPRGKPPASTLITTPPPLSISPLKNARLLNQLGEELGEKYGVRHLPSDFKKKDGYKRSVELSKEYGLYRQDYCGCGFSKAQRQREKEERKDS